MTGIDPRSSIAVTTIVPRPADTVRETGQWAQREQAREPGCGRLASSGRPGDTPREPMPDVIEFYSPGDPYGELSNFAPFPIKLGGKRWPTSEHYFQAQKFAGTSHEEDVRRAKKPRLAAEMGRDRKRPLRRDWESVKESVMLAALRAKFTQHDDLRALLLGTGDARLVEHTANDAYWGDGGDGSGKNRLGQILASVREELRKSPPD